MVIFHNYKCECIIKSLPIDNIEEFKLENSQIQFITTIFYLILIPMIRIIIVIFLLLKRLISIKDIFFINT